MTLASAELLHILFIVINLSTMMITNDESFTTRGVSRREVPTTRMFFDGTFLPPASSSSVVSSSSRSSVRSVLRPPHRSTLALALICGAAVVVMIGSFSQIQASTVRQLRSGIVRAIGPIAFVGQDEDDASPETEDQDDSQFINATENNGGNYFLDLFLEALVIDDTSDLTEGKDSTDSNVEIVFEEPLNNMTTVSSTPLLNSTDFDIVDEIDIIISGAEHKSNTDREASGVEAGGVPSGLDIEAEAEPAVTIHART